MMYQCSSPSRAGLLCFLRMTILYNITWAACQIFPQWPHPRSPNLIRTNGSLWTIPVRCAESSPGPSKWRSCRTVKVMAIHHLRCSSEPSERRILAVDDSQNLLIIQLSISGRTTVPPSPEKSRPVSGGEVRYNGRNDLNSASPRFLFHVHKLFLNWQWRNEDSEVFPRRNSRCGHSMQVTTRLNRIQLLNK